MTRIGIIAALPGELKPLVKGWHATPSSGVHLWSFNHERGEWIAACSGMGADAAARSFHAIERDGRIDAVCSLGWAGALTQQCKPGQVYAASEVVDLRTGERFAAARWSSELRLVSSPIVAGWDEKRRLTEAYSAALVDMEAATVARLAQIRGIPFYCMKAVSDGVEDRLPDFNRFLDERGQLSALRLAAHAAFRPQLWPVLLRLGENSRRGAQNLAGATMAWLDERGYHRDQNGNDDDI
jgi:adenosylhomocysteine nucleosidase